MAKIRPMTMLSRKKAFVGPAKVTRSRATCEASLKSSDSTCGDGSTISDDERDSVVEEMRPVGSESK